MKNKFKRVEVRLHREDDLDIINYLETNDDTDTRILKRALRFYIQNSSDNVNVFPVSQSKTTLYEKQKSNIKEETDSSIENKTISKKQVEGKESSVTKKKPTIPKKVIKKPVIKEEKPVEVSENDESSNQEELSSEDNMLLSALLGNAKKL